MSDDDSQTDGSAEAPRPRYGPVRRVYRIVYWVVSMNLIFSTAVGVTLHVFRTPEGVGERVPEGALPTSEAGRACQTDLRTLYGTLQTRARDALAGGVPTATLAREWQAFSQDWRGELDAVRHRCRLSEAPMAPLADVARDLERLRVAYTTAILGFADDGRATYDRLEAALTPEPAPR